MARNRRRRQQTAAPVQPDYPSKKTDALDSGHAVSMDHLPPNSELVNMDDDNAEVDDSGFPVAKSGSPSAAVAPVSPDGVTPVVPKPLPPPGPLSADMGDPYQNFPPAPPVDPPTVENPEVTVSQFKGGLGGNASPTDQTRVTILLDEMELKHARVSGRLVPNIRFRGVMALVRYYRLQDNPGIKGEPAIQTTLLTQPTWFTLPLWAVPLEFRRDPSRITIRLAAQLLTSIFATYPFEVMRPAPKPTELLLLPADLREQLIREAMAAGRLKDARTT